MPTPRPRVRVGFWHILPKINRINGCELIQIAAVYTVGIERGDGQLQKLSATLGRTVPFISRQARRFGLTSYNRKACEKARAATAARVKGMWQTRPHPRGYLGKKHSYKTGCLLGMRSRAGHAVMTDEAKAASVEKMLKTKILQGNLVPPRHKVSWKGGWREISERRIYMRSQWEETYALYLDNLKRMGAIQEWEYEPETFWFLKIKRGCRSYTPDFRVTHQNGDIEYHEVKGWMDDRSVTKIKRMKIYHPTVRLVVIDAPAFRRLFPHKR